MNRGDHALVVALALACAAAHAHAGAPTPVPPAEHARTPQSATALRLDTEAPALAAHYVVRVKASPQAASALRDWYFVREPGRIALIRGAFEDHWLRDDAGRIRFERVLHQHRTVAEYSSGELAALAIEPDWAALSRLIDPAELARLAVVRVVGDDAARRVDLAGRSAGDTLQVRWSPGLQLPLRVERRSSTGASISLELVRHAAAPLPGWPQPGERSEGYARIDAADFGDQGYDPAVRLAEAIDVRAGWRKPHGHD